MKKIARFKKYYYLKRANPYGIIRLFFEDGSQTDLPRLNPAQFLAISDILQSKKVEYDPNTKKFVTGLGFPGSIRSKKTKKP